MLVSTSYFTTVVGARYQAGGAAVRTLMPKARGPQGSGVGLRLRFRCCCSGLCASDCTPFTAGICHPTYLWSSSSHTLRMHLGLHGWTRPCGRRVSAHSLRGPAALMGMRTHGEPSAHGLEPVPRAVKTPNFPPAAQRPRRVAFGGADGASFLPGSPAQGQPEGARPLQ
jgi:hypothetical protein